MAKQKVEKVDKICGIVMPISDHDEYPKGHWMDVYQILKEAIDELTEFTPKLVSEDPAIALIHETIVDNLYKNPIVVCDVSSKNPNVMFELGLRLAFDKPTIIIKDDETTYSFDTGGIEHLNYPISLRFNGVVEFKKKLADKINATYEKSQNTPNYSPFLKSFGRTIVPAKIEGVEISEYQYVISELTNIKSLLLKQNLIQMDIPKLIDPLYLSENTKRRIKLIPKEYEVLFSKVLDENHNNTLSKTQEIFNSELINQGLDSDKDYFYDLVLNHLQKNKREKASI